MAEFLEDDSDVIVLLALKVLRDTGLCLSPLPDTSSADAMLPELEQVSAKAVAGGDCSGGAEPFTSDVLPSSETEMEDGFSFSGGRVSEDSRLITGSFSLRGGRSSSCCFCSGRRLAAKHGP